MVWDLGAQLGGQPSGSAQGISQLGQPEGGGSGSTEESLVLWRAEKCQGVVNN